MDAHISEGGEPAARAVDEPLDPSPAAEVPLSVCVGDDMEVTSFEEGLVGSWYQVRILQVDGTSEDQSGQLPEKALVMYSAYGDAEQEWVSLSRLRPLPPPPPTRPEPHAWVKRLKSNVDTVELQYESGWWEVQYVSRAGQTVRVLAVRYGKVHEVEVSAIRPGWHRCASGEWTFSLGGVKRTLPEWEERLAKPPASTVSVRDRLASSAIGPRSTLAGVAHVGGTGIDLAPVAGDRSNAVHNDGANEADGTAQFKWGVAVEVLSYTANGAGSWHPAEVLKVIDGQSLLVDYLAESAVPANATIDVSAVRPAPPHTPAGWAANLRQGEVADVYHEDAWWQVVLEARKNPKAKVRLADCGDDPGTQLIEVDVARLRPRYVWLGWRNGWQYTDGGMQVNVTDAPTLPMSHHLPPIDGGIGQTGRGRPIIKPKAFQQAAEASSRRPAPLLYIDPDKVPKAGDILEVEVAEPDSEGTSWKPAEVIAELQGHRFTAMVNGDDDFIEDFGMEDEDKEWRRVSADKLDSIRAENEALKKAFAAAQALAASESQSEVAVDKPAGKGSASSNAKKRKKASGATQSTTTNGPEDQEREPERDKRPKQKNKAAPANAFQFAFGMQVEVQGRDTGFIGSWYAAEVLKVNADGVAVIAYDSQAGLVEDVPVRHLRPRPPDSPPGWMDTLKPGAGLEMHHEDGWWEVLLVSKQKGATTVLVHSSHWGTQHTVDIAALRPGWCWDVSSDSWS